MSLVLTGIPSSLHKGNWTNVSGAAVFALILMLLVAIVISRMVFVFPICFLQNMWNSKKLSISDMVSLPLFLSSDDCLLADTD